MTSRPGRRNYLARFLSSLTPSWMGVGPLAVFYLLLGSAVASIFLLKWAAATMAENGAAFAWWIGGNCLGFLALSFYLAVRRRSRISVVQRVKVWLESIPLAIALIASIAYAAIAGSVYSSVEPAYGKLYIFHSLWFVLLILFLAINLVMCSYDKSVQVFLLPGRRDFRRNPGFFTGLRTHRVVPFGGTAEQAQEVFREVYPRAHAEGPAAYAQRGIFSRFGPTVVHIGLLFAMAAGGYRILSERIGFRIFAEAPAGMPIPSSKIAGLGLFDSQIQIREGETTDTIMVKRNQYSPFSSSNSREVSLDFQVKAHNFEADMYPGTQVPRYFATLLEITTDDGGRIVETVDMNTAVAFRGYKFSQNSYSQVPSVERSLYEIVDVQTGARYRTDIGPDTRNWISPEAHLRHKQIAIEEDAVGGPWRLIDASQDDRVLAEGEILEGPSGLTVRPMRFFPDFQMTPDGPTSVSDELNNPVLLVHYNEDRPGNQFGFIFFNPTMEAINAPAGLSVQALDLRQAGERPLDQFHTTGDTEPVPIHDHDHEGEDHDHDHGEDEEDSPAVAAANEMLRGYEFLIEVADPTTGRTLSRDWAGARTALSVTPGALPSSAEDAALERQLAAARENGDRFLVRRIGPAPGFMTVLGVIRDPSLPYLYIGCLIVIFGVLQSFMMTYRECWLLHKGPKDKGEPGRVYMAMKTRGSGEKPFVEFERLAARLAEIGGSAGGAGPDTSGNGRRKPGESDPPEKKAALQKV